MDGFNLGKITVTNNVRDAMKNDISFAHFVNMSLGRYANHDWGNVDEEDAEANKEAIEDGGHIYGCYEYKKDLSKTIWIITEPDLKTTTILFMDPVTEKSEDPEESKED